MKRGDKVRIVDSDDLRKWRTEIPNMVMDMGLSPYALSLYVHAKRTAGANEGGECTYSSESLAKKCGMSVGKIFSVKRELIERGLITITPGDRVTPDTIYICNIWAENFAHFSGRCIHGVNTGIHGVNTGIHGVNTGIHGVNVRSNPSGSNPSGSNPSGSNPNPTPTPYPKPNGNNGLGWVGLPDDCTDKELFVFNLLTDEEIKISEAKALTLAQTPTLTPAAVVAHIATWQVDRAKQPLDVGALVHRMQNGGHTRDIPPAFLSSPLYARHYPLTPFETRQQKYDWVNRPAVADWIAELPYPESY